MQIVICNTDLGNPTTAWHEEGRWTYSGPCEDVFIRVHNFGGGLTGTMAAIKEDTGDWLPTKIGATDATALNGTVVYNPTDLNFFTDENYDYAANGWVDVMDNTGLTAQVTYAIFAVTRNDPVAWSFVDGDGGMDPSWYRAILPFC